MDFHTIFVVGVLGAGILFAVIIMAVEDIVKEKNHDVAVVRRDYSRRWTL